MSLQGLREYRPTKAAMVWVAAGASVLTMIVGFTFGGWVTGGTADKMVRDSRLGAQAELAASVCAANFRATPTAREQHAELTALSGFRQRQYVQDQPWARVPGADGVNRPAAEICARMISEMDPEELEQTAT